MFGEKILIQRKMDPTIEPAIATILQPYLLTRALAMGPKIKKNLQSKTVSLLHVDVVSSKL